LLFEKVQQLGSLKEELHPTASTGCEIVKDILRIQSDIMLMNMHYASPLRQSSVIARGELSLTTVFT